MIYYKTRYLLAVAAFLTGSSAFAQIKSPAASPLTELEQVVGITNFEVDYCRPSVKGRDIYGGLVPYGEIWRTGANAPTTIEFDTEVTFADQTLPAGEYVLFTIPGEAMWTVIFYGDSDVPNAAAYDPKNDAARISVAPIKLATAVESFTIGFDDLRDESATLFLDWADVRVPIQLSIDTASLTAASIRSSMDDMDDWTARDYANAAEFYHAQGIDSNQALQWMGKATSMNKNAFWWQHTYARMLADNEKKAEAIAAAERSLKTAKASTSGDFGYIARNQALLETLR
jgi:hypothetical protein